jgi:hypothetical protein
MEDVRLEQHLRPPVAIEALPVAGLDIDYGMQFVLTDTDAMGDAGNVDVLDALRRASECSEVRHGRSPWVT